jgi:hypothetical protein
MYSSKLNHSFATACFDGDIKTVVNMYNEYYLNKSKFSQFIGIFNLNSTINPNFNNDTPIMHACWNGQSEVVEFLLSDKKFKKNDKLASGLNMAMGSGNLKIAEIILPLLKENNYCYDRIHNGFVEACKNGHLNIVEYMTTQSLFDFNKFKFRHPNHITSMKLQGFINACENGHSDVVKYLTSSPKLKEHVDVDQVKQVVRIDNFEIIRHFIFDLELNENDSFMMRINTNHELFNQIEEMFEKKDLHKEINEEFNDNLVLPPKKRPKL